MWLLCDFETFSSCDLKKSGAWRYAEDPTTGVICFCYELSTGYKGTWTPGDEQTMLAGLAADPDVTFVAHNAQFEKAIWRHIMVPDFGFPDIPNKRWDDTMATCAHKALPQELEEVLRVLRLDSQKDMEGRKVTLGMSKTDKKGNYDRSLAKRERAIEYCAQDVHAEVALLKRVGRLPPAERNVWLLNQRVNERGIRLDLDFVRAAQKIVDDASLPLLQEFDKITGGIAPSQGKKFIAWLTGRGCHIDNLQKETVSALIGNHEGDDDEDDFPREPNSVALAPDVHRALRIRQLVGSASIKKLKRMELCVSTDGRARGLSQYHGTSPGRAAGRLLQPYNFPRGTLKLDGKAPKPELIVDAIMTGDYQYVEQVTGVGAVEVVVSSLRHALVPNPDRVFISGDYAGIQARVVLALAGQKDKLGIFSDDRTGRKGEDIYLDMASQIYKRSITKNDARERQVGKASVLGLGFQLGWSNFKVKFGPEHSDEFAQEIVRVYRKEWAPQVPFCWYGLQDAAVKCVHHGRPTEAYGISYALEDGALSCRLPSGRKIWYQHPQKVMKPVPWDAEDIRPAFDYWRMKNGRWQCISAFGGLLTENVVMGIEVDIQRHAQFLCEKAGFPVVLEVYDEIVVEPEKANADEKAFKQILLDVEPWVKHLEIPIAVETWVGDRYRK